MAISDRIVRNIALVILVAGCVAQHEAPTPERTVPTFPAGWRHDAGATATFAEQGMVASDSELASRAGIEVLRGGGNAVDAAVATGFTLAVTLPTAGNIGGGGFMVIRLDDGEEAALDFREVAPLGATHDMYLDDEGNPTDETLAGHRAVAVPGSVAGLLEAHQRFGRLPLGDVMAPAIRLAEDGFAVDSLLSFALARPQIAPNLMRFAGSEIFYPDGSPLLPGALLVQPDLAGTLRQIAAEGGDAFYEGAVAELIVEEMRRGGGIITKEDLKGYRPIWREPLLGTYRDYSLIAMPLSSSGGTAIVEALNILETFDPLPPFESTRYKHLLAESLKRTFNDRNTTLCDPAFCDPPVARLTSKEYAREQAGTIDLARASASQTAAGSEGMHTTHYSVVDAEGNAVSTTTSLNTWFGSGVWVEDAGFFLNNTMDDFTTAPGQENVFRLVQGDQNRIEPGKRPLSSMSPTIVLDPSGDVLIVTGGAGGPMIITSVLQLILSILDHRMTAADAVQAPRIHHQAWPDTLLYEQGGLTAAVVDSLLEMGHGLFMVPERAGRPANINAIMRVRGGWQGIAPGRLGGAAAAVGY